MWNQRGIWGAHLHFLDIEHETEDKEHGRAETVFNDPLGQRDDALERVVAEDHVCVVVHTTLVWPGLERRLDDNGEVVAGTAQPPEQIRVDALRGLDDGAVPQRNFGPEQRIAHQAVLAHQTAHSAAEHHAEDSNAREGSNR